MSRSLRAATPSSAPVYQTTVRPATEADVPAICAIHNQGIEDRATLDTVPYTVDEKLAWLRAHGPMEPVLVAEVDGEVVGWVSLTRFSPRPAYDRIKELSIYVRRDWRDRGVGNALMQAVLAEARRLGLHKVVLTTFFTLPRAVHLYRKYGFRRVGVYRRQGMLDGRWMDTLVMERLLDEAP